jgi:hypothetical protein
MKKPFASHVMKNNLATEETSLRPEHWDFVMTGCSETPFNLPLERGAKHL